MTKDFPLVSILMTSYNREKYIGEAIESVLNSTFQQWELIIVDDQSKDRTVEIAREFEKKDRRIKVFINESNLGDYPNRNKAASYAKGKYLKYLDADDTIYPHGLAVLVEMMGRNPAAGYGLCSFPQDVDKPFPKLLSPREAFYRNYFVSSIFHKAPLSSIISKEAFQMVGGFDPIRMAGDYNMWHKLSQKFPVLLMPDGIVWNRVHDSQEMNEYQKFFSSYWAVKERFLIDEATPLLQDEKKMLLNNLRKEKWKFYIKNMMKVHKIPYFKLWF